MEKSDEDLVALYKAGDPTGFDELVRRYTPRLYSFIYRLTGNRDVSEDLTQDTFVKAWSGLSSGAFGEGRRFQPWVFTVARNTATDYMRKKKAIPFSIAYPDDSSDTIADTANIEAELVAEENVERVTAALEKLSPHAREILLLRYQGGLTFEEAADALGLSVNTVKSRGRRALLELKPHLEALHLSGAELRTNQ